MNNKKTNIEELKKEIKNVTLKINMYALKDLKEMKFAQPFYAPNDDMAKRMLYGSVNNGEKGSSYLVDYPSDYELYKLGTYDEKTGELTSELKFLVNAGEYKNKDYKEI